MPFNHSYIISQKILVAYCNMVKILKYMVWSAKGPFFLFHPNKFIETSLLEKWKCYEAPFSFKCTQHLAFTFSYVHVYIKARATLIHILESQIKRRKQAVEDIKRYFTEFISSITIPQVCQTVNARPRLLLYKLKIVLYFTMLVEQIFSV